MNLTQEEMQKLAWSISSLTNVGNILSKTVPKFFGGVKNVGKAVGLTAANSTKAGVVTGVMGGVSGVASGATDQNPETQTRSMVTRGVIGAVGGFMGGRALAKKMPTMGDSYSAVSKTMGNKMLSLAGTKGLTAEQRSSKLTDFAAKNLTTQTKTIGRAKSTKNFFGIGAKVKSTEQVTNPKLPWGAKMIGDIANSAKNVRKEGIIKGVGKTLKDNWHESKFFDKAISKKEGAPKFRFQRSLAGRIVNPAMTAGVGMGAISAAQATNDDGGKPTVAKRLKVGVKDTLTWGMAPHLMMGKAMAYDIPKTIMGGNN